MKENKVNILDYKNKQKKLTEEDVTGLFLGLVKIVKRYAMDEIIETYSRKNDLLSNNIKNILEENRLLKEENESLKKGLLQNHAKKIERARKLVSKLSKFKVQRSKQC